MNFNIKPPFWLAPILFSFAITACRNPAITTSETPDSSAHIHLHNDSLTTKKVAIDEAGSDYQTVYLTIADTGNKYYPLQTLMYNIHAASGLSIDTLNRYYNPTKNDIIVAENDDDEMYRGEYFPRRFPGNNLSIEHLNTYTRATSSGTFALVAAICETKTAADSVLKIIAPFAKKAFVVKGEIYAGCMH